MGGGWFEEVVDGIVKAVTKSDDTTSWLVP